MSTLFIGGVVHSVSLDELSYLPRALLFVSPDGKIEWLEEDVPSTLSQETAAAHGVNIEDGSVTVVELSQDQFLCPGLIDTHTHAPQYPNMGLGQEYQLLDWLDQVTFPTEAKYVDEQYAEYVYSEVVKRNLNAGTTTCCYYGTLHGKSTAKLADVVHQRGQRALVGKCNMDRNCPDNYREPSASQSIADTKALIEYIRALPTTDSAPSRLVQPVITPRFAISCSDELLTSLGELVKSDPSLAVQTHLSENPREIAFTQELFPSSSSYTNVYDRFGLLRPGTILAHSVHLSADERDVIKRTGAGISHCPTSNSNLSSGLANVGKMLDDGIQVGLGTDCSGGFSIGVLSQVRQASFVSKMITLQQSDNPEARYAGKALSIPTLFYLATLGGATIARLDDRVGNFAQGKEFDALLVSTGTSPGMFVLPDASQTSPGSKIGSKERLKVLFEKWLFTSDDRDLHSVFVQGRKTGGTSFV